MLISGYASGVGESGGIKPSLNGVKRVFNHLLNARHACVEYQSISGLIGEC